MSYDYFKRLPEKGRRLLGIPQQRGAARRGSPTAIRTSAAPLRAATTTYVHKPAMILFQSLALAAIDAAGTKFRRPTLDLGCGDGSFTGALLQVTGGDKVDAGADIDERALARGRRRGAHAALHRADAENLPFSDGAFGTVFSHCALCCMHRDPALVLKEIHRVTKTGGKLVFTVATARFNSNYVLSHWLERLGLPAAAARYRTAVDARMSHVYCLTAGAWTRLAREAGFEVTDASGFADDRVIRLYSVLIWTPLRVFALLKLIPLAPARRGAASLMRLAFYPIYQRQRIRVNADDSCYLLICARKR